MVGCVTCSNEYGDLHIRAVLRVHLRLCVYISAVSVLMRVLRDARGCGCTDTNYSTESSAVMLAMVTD